MTSYHIFMCGPLKDNLHQHHYMDNEDTAEHHVLVAAEEEQQQLPGQNRGSCSKVDEDCSQQWRIYLNTTMSSAMLYGIFNVDILLCFYLNKNKVLQIGRAHV